MRKFFKYMCLGLLGVALSLSFHPDTAQAGAPAVSAQSAILMDQSSGRVLFRKNAEQRLPIASITKVMTAVLAIESGKGDQYVNVSAKAVRAEGSSLYLKSGERMKLRDLTFGLMLRSGNDASLAIADAVGGSESGFVFKMNEKAHMIGMTNTHFTNPNGLENPHHYSTAADMARLMRYAMNNAQFRKIVATTVYRAAATNKEGVRVWKNENKMLRLYPYATGGKTGFTKKAGRTLISTASKDKLGLIAVTLNDRDDWRDHQALFHWAYAHYKAVTAAKAGRIKARVLPVYQKRLYIHRTCIVPVTDKEQTQLKKELILLKPEKTVRVQKETAVGRLNIVAGRQTLASLPVYYRPPTKQKNSFWSRFMGILHEIVVGEGGFAR